ncbi:MAG TPA: hypothetical protein VFN13_08475, partial [Rudaea sp.]|nr:hypothetical protein [Rudaea sp.]
YFAAALTLAAGSVCWTTAHADEMMAMPGNGYPVASNAPVNDMDSASITAHDDDNDVGAARASIISGDNDGADMPTSNHTGTDNALAHRVHASPAHHAAVTEPTVPPAVANPPKNPTSVRWQSLLPGVMK